ncbi:hypothetical protein JCM5296_000388 [Sporobolomyces johnsonii]
MSSLDWQAPDFLANPSGDDYLASLTSFLDGPTKTPADFPTASVFSGGFGQPVAGEPSSPELTSDSASPSSSDGLHASATSNPAMPATRGRQSNASAEGGHMNSHDKRKNGAQGPAAIKDRRASGGKNTTHSHPAGVDGDVARSASPEDGDHDAKGGPKGKTSERRRAQNRQAQRNFRERKEKHLKDLEDRVVTLEQKTTEQETENEALKQLLQHLQSENERLKVFESAFSFSYAKDVSDSSAMPTSSTFKPPTPPTVQDELDDVSAAFKFDTNNAYNLPSHPASSVSGPSLFSSAPAFSLPPPSAGMPAFPAPRSGTSGVFSDSLFLNSLTAPVPTSAGGPSLSPATATTSSISNLATPPGTSDLFFSYRDPLADMALPQPTLSTFADLDALLGPSAPSTSLAEDPLSAFIKSPSPALPTGLSPAPTVSAESTAATTPSPTATGKGAMCPMAARGEKYEFDVEGLCSEYASLLLVAHWKARSRSSFSHRRMKLKATCQEAARQALKSAMAEDAKASRQAYPTQL